jgi:hypothetical protein
MFFPSVSSRGRVRDQPLSHLTSRTEHGCSALRHTHRIKHSVSAGASVLCITTPPEEGAPSPGASACTGQTFSVLCGYVLEEDRSAVVRQHYRDCHDTMDVMASSTCKTPQPAAR